MVGPLPPPRLSGRATKKRTFIAASLIPLKQYITTIKSKTIQQCWYQCFVSGSGSVCIRFILVSDNHGKFTQSPPKSLEYHTFLQKILNLCLTDIYFYPIKNKTDHFWKKYIFLIEKKILKVGIFSILGRIRSRIRVCYFTKRIRGSRSKWNGSETLVGIIIIKYK